MLWLGRCLLLAIRPFCLVYRMLSSSSTVRGLEAGRPEGLECEVCAATVVDWLSTRAVCIISVSDITPQWRDLSSHIGRLVHLTALAAWKVSLRCRMQLVSLASATSNTRSEIAEHTPSQAEHRLSVYCCHVTWTGKAAKRPAHSALRSHAVLWNEWRASPLLLPLCHTRPLRRPDASRSRDRPHVPIAVVGKSGPRA